MLLAALIHAGLEQDYLRAELAKLHLDGLEFTAYQVRDQGITAFRIKVNSFSGQKLRTLSSITNILENSDLEKDIISKSLEVFTLLAEAEAAVHGTGVEEIHFHEIGAIDTVADIVGSVIGLKKLGVERLYCSPLPFSRGFVECCHGKLPLTAPAVGNLLASVPVYGVNFDCELVTPTGAALVKKLAHSFGIMPPMILEKTGYGGGERKLPDNQPNLLRIFLGRSAAVEEAQEVQIIETNLDDWAAEGFDFVGQRLMEAGAVDVCLIPIQMKKGRPGYTLQVIGRKHNLQQLADIILTETTAIGLRYRSENRITLPRKEVLVATKYGEIKAKEVYTPAGQVIYPEYEECRKAAQKQGVSLSQIYREIIRGEKK